MPYDCSSPLKHLEGKSLIICLLCSGWVADVESVTVRIMRGCDNYIVMVTPHWDLGETCQLPGPEIKALLTDHSWPSLDIKSSERRELKDLLMLGGIEGAVRSQYLAPTCSSIVCPHTGKLWTQKFGSRDIITLGQLHRAVENKW